MAFPANAKPRCPTSPTEALVAYLKRNGIKPPEK